MRLYSFNNYKKNLDLLFKHFAEEIKNLMNENKYDYVILTTRRCFCLIIAVQKKYKIFSDNEWKKIISSQAIKIEDFSNKSVILVDDVMIHGTSVWNIYSKLQETNIKNIDTFVLAKSVEYPDFYRIQTGKSYKQLLLLSQDDWQYLSNEIVYYFYDNNIPYISYVYGANIANNSWTKIQFKYSNFDANIYSIIKEVLKERSEKTTIYYNALDSKLVRYSCIRKYDFNTTIHVPYCELKEFAADSIEICWKNMKKSFPLERLYDNITSPVDIYKVYLILLSLIQINEFKIFTKWIDKSFYNGFYYDISQLIKSLNNHNINTLNELEDLLIDFGLKTVSYTPKEQSSIYLKALNNINYKQNDAFINLLMYIVEISKKESANFKNVLKKYYDDFKLNTDDINHKNYFPSSYILSFFKSNNKYEIISFIIFLLDSGIISHNIEEIKGENGQKIVATVLKTGEQSYRIPYLINPYAFVIAVKYCDHYISTHKKYEPTIEEINDFVSYLNTDNNYNVICKKTNDYLELLLLSIEKSNISDLFFTFETLKNNIILDELSPVFKKIKNYFYDERKV